MTGDQASIVSALICRAHVGMAIKCLGSLLQQVVGIEALQIHDDGSLREEDVTRLTEALGHVKIIRRAEADQELAGKLKPFPTLAKIRQSFPLMLKLLDGPLLAPGAIFAFSDSDVFYHQRVENPFSLARHQKNAVFMQDRAPSYSMRSWQLLLRSGLRLPKKVNTGLIAFRREELDLDFLEHLFQWSGFHAIPGMREQTAWAALGERSGCAVFDQSQVRVMRAGELQDSLAIGHYTARTRHILDQIHAAPSMSQQSPTILRVLDAGQASAFDLFRYEVGRVVARGMPKSIQPVSSG